MSRINPDERLSLVRLYIFTQRIQDNPG